MFIVTIGGNLGKDPETRFTPSGQKVTSFNVAVNQRKGKEEITIWVRVNIWGDRFDKMISYLKKGSSVIVTGKMNPPAPYTDKEGRPQASLEVTAEMIEFSPFGRSDKQSEGQQYSSSQSSTSSEEGQYQANPSASSQYRSSSYGNNYGSAGQQNQLVDEDALPF